MCAISSLKSSRLLSHLLMSSCLYDVYLLAFDTIIYLPKHHLCHSKTGKMSNFSIGKRNTAYRTTVDNSRHYKNNLLTDETVPRLSATFKLSFRTIFCGTNRTVLCLHLRWLTCGVEYCDCGQCGCGTSRNGRGLLPIGDNSYVPWPSYLSS